MRANAAAPQLAGLTRLNKILLALAIVLYLPLAGVSFRSSFEAVRDQAVLRGFARNEAWSVPAGVDVGIICLSVLDLLLTGLRMPFPLLRHVVRLLTVATIWFNAVAGHGDPVAVCMHGLVPTLFIIYIEAFRHLVRRYTGQVTGAGVEGIPLARWIADPFRTVRMKRRMVLWGETSYSRALQIEQQVRHALAQLRHEYGDDWKHAAPGDVVWMLKTGVHVDEACARVAELTAPPKARTARGLLEELYGTEWRRTAPAGLVRLADQDASIEQICAHVAELTTSSSLRRRRAPEPNTDDEREDEKELDRQDKGGDGGRSRPSGLYELAKPVYLACQQNREPFDTAVLRAKHGGHPGSWRKIRRRLQHELGPIEVDSSDADQDATRPNGSDSGDELEPQAARRERIPEDALR